MGSGSGAEELPEPLSDGSSDGCSDGVVGSVVEPGGEELSDGSGVCVGLWPEELSSEGSDGSEGDSVSSRTTVTVHSPGKMALSRCSCNCSVGPSSAGTVTCESEPMVVVVSSTVTSSLSSALGIVIMAAVSSAEFTSHVTFSSGLESSGVGEDGLDEGSVGDGCSVVVGVLLDWAGCGSCGDGAVLFGPDPWGVCS